MQRLSLVQSFQSQKLEVGNYIEVVREVAAVQRDMAEESVKFLEISFTELWGTSATIDEVISAGFRAETAEHFLQGEQKMIA